MHVSAQVIIVTARILRPKIYFLTWKHKALKYFDILIFEAFVDVHQVEALIRRRHYRLSVLILVILRVEHIFFKLQGWHDWKFICTNWPNLLVIILICDCSIE